MSPALVDALTHIFGRNSRLVRSLRLSGRIPRFRTHDTSIELAFEAALKQSPLAGLYVKQCGAVKPLHPDFGFPDVKLAVEADGEFFHGRTPEQARRDEERDAILRAAGWVTLRYWGNDLLHHARECVDETVRVYRILAAGD